MEDGVKKAIINLSLLKLREMLGLPEGIRVDAVAFDFRKDGFQLRVEGDSLPVDECREGNDFEWIYVEFDESGKFKEFIRGY
jgi:hypothetical protein